jgi:hypothetical protein
MENFRLRKNPEKAGGKRHAVWNAFFRIVKS